MVDREVPGPDDAPVAAAKDPDEKVYVWEREGGEDGSGRGKRGAGEEVETGVSGGWI